MHRLVQLSLLAGAQPPSWWAVLSRREERRKRRLPVPSPTSKELSQKPHQWLLVASLKARPLATGRCILV